MNPVPSVSVFGLGKLGATMVGCFASKGFDVVGVDLVESVVLRAAAGTAPVAEPGLQALYTNHRARIMATSDAADAVRRTEASFIIVPTPSRADGSYDTSAAAKVAEAIGTALRSVDRYHLVVLTSTVLPGDTEAEIKGRLERFSGKRCGDGFGLCYSPEFIAIGNVIEGLLRPDFFLIGESDERAGELLEGIYRRQGGEGARIARMNLVSAELTKISVNTFVTAKISFASTLSQIAGRIPGADAQAVSSAVGLDARIGPRCLRPGPAFGGPCFPRDNRAFAYLAERVGARAPSARATDEINHAQNEYLAQLVREVTPPSGKVAILGLSYKPRTGLMEESHALFIVRALRSDGFRVAVHDPLASPADIAAALPKVETAASVDECLKGASTVVLSTNHEEYAPVRLADVIRLAPGAAVVDLWGKWLTEAPSFRVAYRVPGRYFPAAGKEK